MGSIWTNGRQRYRAADPIARKDVAGPRLISAANLCLIKSVEAREAATDMLRNAKKTPRLSTNLIGRAYSGNRSFLRSDHVREMRPRLSENDRAKASQLVHLQEELQKK